MVKHSPLKRENSDRYRSGACRKATTFWNNGHVIMVACKVGNTSLARLPIKNSEKIITAKVETHYSLFYNIVGS